MNESSPKLSAAHGEAEREATFIENYARRVVERVIPSLELKSPEVAALIEVDAAHWMHSTDESVSGTCLEIGYTPPFSSLDYEQMEMALMRHTLFSFAFVGLFHLFERQLAGILRILDYRWQGAVWGKRGKPVSVSFKTMLAKVNTELRYIPNDDVMQAIERLRLICNAVKHSDKDLIIIAKDHRELLRGWHEKMPLTPECLALTRDLFEDFTTHIAAFWRAFPQE